MKNKKTLTATQREIANLSGLSVIWASAGSGKTLAVAARIAEKLRDWEFSYRGIAAISFTNVAWQEIERYLKEDFDIIKSISYPHFIGTIDSFINQYIFLPFGHLVMNCSKRPELVGPPFNDWEPIGNGWYWGNAECNRKSCKLNDFTYDVNDNLINLNPISHFNRCSCGHRFCGIKKKSFSGNGYATQSDANYFAMKILKEYKTIAKAISYRFPIFIVDEAQDTSEIQMKLIDYLIQNGSKEVILIGDPDQAIYEWRTAKPNLFIEKYNNWKDNSIELRENWRSSQNICDFFCHISSFDSIEAKNKNVKEFDFYPELWMYEEKQFDVVINNFLKVCAKNGIDLCPANVAVLSRSYNFVEDILFKSKVKRDKNPWRDRESLKIAKSKYLYEQGEYAKAFHLLEKTICGIVTDRNVCTHKDIINLEEEHSFVSWRGEVFNFLNELPKANCALKDWEAKANNIIKDSIIPDFRIGVKKRKEYYELGFEEVFSLDEKKVLMKEYMVGTIHSVKGETYDAVLLFVGERTTSNQSYSKILDSKIEENEELRNVYVAITRPRKILIIAVPAKDVDIWGQRFFGENK